MVNKCEPTTLITYFYLYMLALLIQCDGLADCCQITMIPMSQRVWPDMRIGDIVTSEKICFGEQGISIADIQTKVVKVVTISPIRMSGQAWLALHIILITPNLLTLSIWIQITIHPLSTDGAIVI